MSLPGHRGIESHFSISAVDPVQNLLSTGPPPLVQSLVLVLRPMPHEVEQSDQAAQSPNSYVPTVTLFN